MGDQRLAAVEVDSAHAAVSKTVTMRAKDAKRVKENSMHTALAREAVRGKEFVCSEFATTCRISAHRATSRLTRFKLQPEQLEKMEVETVLHPSTGLLARDDVTKIGHREDVFLNVSRLGFGETFDPIWRKDQIEVERAVFELNKILVLRGY
jgi:hypothetical protein